MYQISKNISNALYIEMLLFKQYNIIDLNYVQCYPHIKYLPTMCPLLEKLLIWVTELNRQHF